MGQWQKYLIKFCIVVYQAPEDGNREPQLLHQAPTKVPGWVAGYSTASTLTGLNTVAVNARSGLRTWTTR